MVLLPHKRLLSQLFGHKSYISSSPKMEFSLQAFESQISKNLSQLALSVPHNGLPTLSWLHQCLHLLPEIEKAFTKLVSDIDHPMNTWEITSIEQCLKHSFIYLNLLNSIASSISHLQQARLVTAHALSSRKRVEIKSNIIVEGENKWGDREEGEEECCGSSGVEELLNQALRVMGRVRWFVCVIVESGIRGDVELFVKSLKGAGELFKLCSSLGFNEEILRRKEGVVGEVDEINVVLSCGDGSRVDEVQEKVEELGKKLDSIGEDVNKLFSEAMAQRNHLLDSFQQRKQS
ncbi:hypothetical protein Sjap_012843 [Stephania japonica]|uniref:Uncharacterized protein n=1 Tax=Stephania japonica TaxID=461633 RepID=A0AAP0IZA3_9MAGN